MSVATLPAKAPIVAVTVLEDRASITRRGSFPLAAGQQRIVVERVSPILADKTLTATRRARLPHARYERTWRVARRQHLRWPTWPAVEAAARRARKRAHARNEAEALAQLAEAAFADLAVAATRGTASPGAPAHLAELDTLETAARKRAIEAQLEAEDLAAALQRLDVRVARAEAEAGEQAARLIVDVIWRARDAVLTASYVVPGAAWRPYHRAQLDRVANRIEWQTTACVLQATGEDWLDAELTCSLERPSLGVEPPELGDDELSVRRRPDSVVVEAREQDHDDTGLGSGGPAIVPGIDDGGLGTKLVASVVSVRADGAPHRVPVGTFTSQVQLSLVAIPLRSP